MDFEEFVVSKGMKLSCDYCGEKIKPGKTAFTDQHENIYDSDECAGDYNREKELNPD